MHPDEIYNLAAVRLRFGTVKPRRSHVDDLADACVLLMQNYSHQQRINIGWGADVSIAQLAGIVSRTVEDTRFVATQCRDAGRNAAQATGRIAIHGVGLDGKDSARCRYCLRPMPRSSVTRLNCAFRRAQHAPRPLRTTFTVRSRMYASSTILRFRT